MKLRFALCCLVFFTAAVLAAGCSKTPATAVAATAAARSFLEARANDDLSALYGMLTDKAQLHLERSAVAQFLSQEEITFTGVGAPLEREDGWFQVPITNLTITTVHTTVTWPEVRLSMQHDGTRWRVAWVDPLAVQALRAYERSAYGDELDLGSAMIEVDRYHYRGYLEKHFAYVGLRRLREAEVYLMQAMDNATPVQRPDTEDAMARFKLGVKQPADAAERARAALEAAAPYIPATYSVRWQADTLVVLGRALLAQGDRAGAEQVANQAAELDPTNGSLAIFRLELNPPPPF